VNEIEEEVDGSGSVNGFWSDAYTRSSSIFTLDLLLSPEPCCSGSGDDASDDLIKASWVSGLLLACCNGATSGLIVFFAIGWSILRLQWNLCSRVVLIAG